MSEVKGVRWCWLKVMYIWTIVIGGGFGLGIVFVPEQMKSMLNDSCEPALYGIMGSVFLVFGLLSILGLRDPLKFVPILLFEMTYKALWLVGVFLPLLITGRFATDKILIVVIFVLSIIGCLIAIPFRYVFAKQSDA